MLQWVWEAVCSCPFFDERMFAIDSQEVKDLVEGFGGKTIMTSVDCPSGTDRLIEVQAKSDVKSDIWVNWQGDEPLISTEMIGDLLQSCHVPGQDIWTLKHPLTENFNDPSLVKVVTDKGGKALYFSRSQIPHGDNSNIYKHVGLYAFSDEALKKIRSMEPTALEKAERLEQLRFLENGLHIQVHQTNHTTVGIDLPEHLAYAEKLLNMKDLRLTPEAAAG